MTGGRPHPTPPRAGYRSDMLPLILALACRPHLAAGDVPIPEAAPPVPPGLPPAPAPVGPPATLVAQPCGTRAFVREIDLLPVDRFAARDLVSPCPPGARCVWSGIVLRSGTATWREGHLVLEAAPQDPSGPPGPPGVPFPARLVPAGPGLLQDDEGCPYRVEAPGPR